MTIEDRVAALFKEADPVPDPDGLERERFTGYLAVIEQRSSEMSQVDEKLIEVKPRRRRNPIPILVAVAAVLIAIVGIGLLAANTSDEPDVATTATPVDVATVFVEAQNSYDAETALALLAPDAHFGDPITQDQGELTSLFRFYEITAHIWTVEPCQADAADPTSVVCPMFWTNAWAEALNTGGYDGEFRFTVEDGVITNFELGVFDWPRYSHVRDSMVDFINQNHFDQRLAVFDYGRGAVPKLTDRALELWEQFTAEFVAAQSG